MPEPHNAPANTGARNFRLGIAVDFLIYSIPFVEYRICADCSSPYTIVDQGRANRGVIALGLVPSYELPSGITLFGGFTARNHPTVERTGIEGPIDGGSQDVRGGPFNITAAAGASYTHPQTGLSAALLVHQTVSSEVARYYPTISAALSIPLLRRRAASAGTLRY